jgi:hypothetical protein
MSQSRMFRDDNPASEGEVPSPRTTIVGGRPPEEGAELPPVPTGIQQMLRLASVDAAFRRELLDRRGELAALAGVELTSSERAILRSVPTPQLEAMIVGLPPPPADRRTFLRETASSAVLLLGGAALAATEGCNRPSENLITRGAAADPPPIRPAPSAPDTRPGPATQGIRPDPPASRPVHNEMDTDGGANPRVPPRPLETQKRGGARVDTPRPDHNEMTGLGGIRAPEPEVRPKHQLQAPGGAAPDIPKKKPDPDPKRPPRVEPTDGIRPDEPPPKSSSAEPEAGAELGVLTASLHNPMQSGGGAAPDVPPPRPKRPNVTRGIRPRPRPDAGPPRPQHPRPNRGNSSSVDVDDDEE